MSDGKNVRSPNCLLIFETATSVWLFGMQPATSLLFSFALAACLVFGTCTGCRRSNPESDDRDIETQALHSESKHSDSKHGDSKHSGSKNGDSNAPAKAEGTQSRPANNQQKQEQEKENTNTDNNAAVMVNAIELRPDIKIPDGFTAANLNKATTTYLLSAPLDIRTDMILFSMGEIMSIEQKLQAQEIVASYESEFISLAERRRNILTTASNSDETRQDLIDLRAEIHQLSLSIYKKVFRDILSKQQQQDFTRSLENK